MEFKLQFTKQADEQLTQLETDPSLASILKAVRKSLGYMETNLRHPGLETHEFHSMKGAREEKVFESYAGSWRIFWHYGPGKSEITVLAITAHP